MYNPEAVRIWPSKEEKEEALRIEAEEAKLLAIEDFKDSQDAEASGPNNTDNVNSVDESAFNATTGSYSGLYGQGPVDAETKAALDAIMNATSSQSTVDSLLAAKNDPIIPPEQDEIIKEANEIYERLLREAAEDEAKKQAEIDEMRIQADLKFAQQ